MKTGKNGKHPPSAEQLQARERSVFKKKIHKIFVGMGFKYIPTGGLEMHIGHRNVEIDSMFIYENIWLLCEDTIKTAEFIEHIQTKNEAIAGIKSNISIFIETLSELLPDHKEQLYKYDAERLVIFGLYIPKHDPPLTDNDFRRFPNLKFVLPSTLNYFQWLEQAIKVTSRNELFRFLEVEDNQIGLPKSTTEKAEIKAPIIYPKNFTGRKDKVRFVSFMMSAEDIMNSAYVMRKDNWAKSIYLYQRLINKDKIKKIRNYLIENGEAFYNNIIVVLPDEVRVQLEDGSNKKISDVVTLPDKCELIIPKKMNSICIIDGQHRVYAHYESGQNTAQENRIAQLRKQLHLLVTGLVFDEEMTKPDRIKAQSAIFLDINSNASPVAQNVLLQIKRIREPLDGESLAQLTIEKLNEQGVFKDYFQLSELGNGGIKTASIIRFALKYLVTISPSEGKKSLFEYWEGDKESLKREDEDAIEEYTKFCASVLREYFGAIKCHFKEEWDNKESKLLSVITINGFIIALTRQLSINGVKGFEYYKSIFENWKYSFSKQDFLYTSSQYRKFSDIILRDAFCISEEQLSQI